MDSSTAQSHIPQADRQHSIQSTSPINELPPEIQARYPFQSRFLNIEGMRMHYVDEGEGPVLLLLHGNPTWSFYFRELILSLRTSFRVIAPDHIGLGLSDHPTDLHFRSADRVRHLQAFINELNLDSFGLVMHDWGGSIGTALAQKNLNKITKLVYFNTTLCETESLPRIIKEATTPLVGKFVTKFTPRFIKLTTRLGVVRPLPHEVVAGYLYPYQSAARRTAIWDFVSDIPFEASHPSYQTMLELATQLPNLRAIPTLIIWGLKDPCFHRGMLNHVRSHFPHATVVEIPNASHLLLEDSPDEVIPRVKDFFEGKHIAPLRVIPGVSGAAVNPLYSKLEEVSKLDPHLHVATTVRSRYDRLDYSHTRFGDFFNRVQQYRRALTHEGIVPGSKVLMLVPAGEEFLALTYAVMGNGAVPVFIDPGVGRKNLLRCIGDLAPDALIGAPKAHLLRLFKPRLFRATKQFIWASDLPFFGTTLGLMKRYSSDRLDPYPTDSASMIAFTSGATGTPKGVIFTAAMIEAQLKIFTDEFGYTRGQKDLPLLALFSLFNVALGKTSIFAPMNHMAPLTLDPQMIVKVIQELSVDTSFGSPTLWNKISEFAVRYSVMLPSIKKILMAGAPVSRKTLARVQGILPHGDALTPYGATEALPVTAVSGKTILHVVDEPAASSEQGTFVGKPIKGLQVKIIKNTPEAIESMAQAEVLPPFEIGEVIVSGPTVSPRYLNRPDANRISKISDGETFWHRMGDVGYCDREGNLYFCGRKAHVVFAPQKTFYSIPVERIFNVHPQVSRSALITLKAPRYVGVAIEPFPEAFPETEEAQRQFKNELRELAKKHPLTTSIENFYFLKNFPVDGRHNAKIFRDKIPELIEKGIK